MEKKSKVYLSTGGSGEARLLGSILVSWDATGHKSVSQLAFAATPYPSFKTGGEHAACMKKTDEMIKEAESIRSFSS
jgi:hypothetical protein